ncbi:Glycosyl transferase [Lasiodiplodia theobromae]|uniref:Uncharacterized protein n=1 Tax=Lasiodiplodia theobromae TaxID=45133 RepID=A0A5N5DPD9_9PEZI|nr:Glycosyl transferase [Lasiodiplodia theobromae]KAB2579211.1 hypothetical protein DBV05_g2150 [Lasiodiplodia theobromae]KAF4537367.1 Glycosyl transferase [Lasiodiplodia theobromae]
MALRGLLALALGLLAASPARAASSSITPTKNYIDTISGYIELSTCAEGVLSTVVRAQQSGCGDNQALTSYTCFCTDSSSYFRRMISTEVTNSCGSAGTEQASSAVEIFDGYCALGVEHGLSTTSSAQSATGTASPAAGAASTLVTSTTSGSAASATAASASSSNSDSSDNTRTTAIAAGVAVPVGVIGLALVGYLFYRKHVSTKMQQQQLPVASPPAELSVPSEKNYPPQELSPQSVQELPYQTREFHELDGNARHEAESDAVKRG